MTDQSGICPEYKFKNTVDSYHQDGLFQSQGHTEIIQFEIVAKEVGEEESEKNSSGIKGEYHPTWQGVLPENHPGL